jgi:hypothetical protein
MTWHTEILPAWQQRVLAELGPVLKRRGFYLAGGTAVALHLGHRRSQRGAKKDFVDIYGLGVRSGSLRRMLRWYQEKYGVTDIAHLLYSLAYFEDADPERMPRLVWDVNWRTIKHTIQAWVRDSAR